MQRVTPVVLNLIIINVLVYVAQQAMPFVTEWGSLHYFKSSLFKPHQLITHMFMHDPSGMGHLFFNMFSLYMFGSFLENFIGAKKFLVFYMICGLGAGILTQVTIPFSADVFLKSKAALQAIHESGGAIAQIKDWYINNYAMLGASGAIMGVMAAFAWLFPNMELYVMFIPVPIKAKFVIPVFILIDLFGGLYQFAGDNIGHFAHLGGALVGFLLILYWNKHDRRNFY